MISRGAASTMLSDELIFPEDADSTDFCVRDNNNINRAGCSDGVFSESRKQRDNRCSNHKLEVQQQGKWSPKNLATTADRFKPAYKIDCTPTSATASGLTIGTPTSAAASFRALEQSPINHVYSYTYYEPEAAKFLTNTLQKEVLISPIPGPSKSPPRNSIRTLLAKGFRSKANNNADMTADGSGMGTLTAEERHTFRIHYNAQENLYEEVDEQKIQKVLSDNRMVSVNTSTVKEELRLVQDNHFRVLDELNLSFEALIMPTTPSDIIEAGTTIGGNTISHFNMENLSSTLNSKEVKNHTEINPHCYEDDLDSGFSCNECSSSASYNKSLRYYKTGAVMQLTTLPNIENCHSSISNISPFKNNMNSNRDQGIFSCGGGLVEAASTTSSPFKYAESCSDSQGSSTLSSG